MYLHLRLSRLDKGEALLTAVDLKQEGSFLCCMLCKSDEFLLLVHPQNIPESRTTIYETFQRFFFYFLFLSLFQQGVMYILALVLCPQK